MNDSRETGTGDGTYNGWVIVENDQSLEIQEANSVSLDDILSLLIPSIIFLHLFLAPYTKVEESFNVQAVHDILTYDLPFSLEHAQRILREHYDHLTFSGSVPRTFVGPLALAGASWPWIRFGAGFGGELRKQLIVRLVLGLYNAVCLLSFQDGVKRTFGKTAGNWYAVFQASQFHMMYYASRTLPNFFALGLTTLAMRNLLPRAGGNLASKSSRRRYSRALSLLAITGVIFRSEIAVLLCCHALYLHIQPYIRLPLRTIILAGLIGTLLGLTLTVPIDSFFWQKWPLWPELTGFVYNIIDKQSSNWGTQPWHFYFTSALPRLLFNPLLYQICIPFTLSIPILRHSALDILIPNVLFLIVYSFQPHKEWRFIIYVIPPFLAAASAGAGWIWTRRAKSKVYRILSFSLVASTLAAFVANFGMLAVSRLNYPGAEALNRLHALASNDTGVVRVHMDTLTCMTGVTRFMEKPPPVLGGESAALWIYDKTEDEQKLLDPLFWEGFDYALSESPERVIGRWEVLEVVEGFAGVGIARPREDLEDGTMEFRSLGKLLRSQEWHKGGVKGLQQLAAAMWKSKLENPLRQYVTHGWWVKTKMEPRINIMKREKGPLLENIMPDTM